MVCCSAIPLTCDGTDAAASLHQISKCGISQSRYDQKQARPLVQAPRRLELPKLAAPTRTPIAILTCDPYQLSSKHPRRIKGPRPRSARWQCGKYSDPARDHCQIRADLLIVDCLNLRGLNLAISYADRCGFRYPAFARLSVRLPAFALRVLCVPSLYLSGLLMRPALPASQEPTFPLRASRATRRLVSRPIP